MIFITNALSFLSNSKRLVYFVCFIMLLQACSNSQDESDSQQSSLEIILPDNGSTVKFPRPDPFPNVAKILIQGASNKTVGKIFVGGLPGAVKADTEISIFKGEQVIQVLSTAEGSFTAFVEAKAWDKLIVAQEGGQLEILVPPVKQTSSLVGTNPEEIQNVTPVIRSSADEVTIQGRTKAGLGAELLGFNLTSGNIGKAKAIADDSFKMIIKAQPNDVIIIFLNEKPLNVGWMLIAP